MGKVTALSIDGNSIPSNELGNYTGLFQRLEHTLDEASTNKQKTRSNGKNKTGNKGTKVAVGQRQPSAAKTHQYAAQTRRTITTQATKLAYARQSAAAKTA